MRKLDAHTSQLPPEKVGRSKPSHYTKDDVQYFPDTDSSLASDTESPSNPPSEEEYHPDAVKGMAKN